ncbi:hypothetical protein D3C71_1501340 [compost metagenome]
MGQYGCRHQHHDRATGNAGQQAPAEKPAHRQRKGTSEKRQGHRQHHQAQGGCVGRAPRQWMTDQCANQVTHQVGGAEVHHVARGKPVGLDQRGNQRRVGKTRQANTDQTGAQAGKDRQPDPLAWSGRGAEHECSPVGISLAPSLSRSCIAITQRIRAMVMRICITRGTL